MLYEVSVRKHLLTGLKLNHDKLKWNTFGADWHHSRMSTSIELRAIRLDGYTNGDAQLVGGHKTHDVELSTSP